MTEKEKAIRFCEDLLAYLKGPDSVTVRTLEKYAITDGSEAELKLVDGAMKTVGEDIVRGYSFELRLQVWDRRTHK